MHIHSLLRPIAGVVQLPLQVVTDIHYALHFTRSLPQMNTFSSEWVKHVARTFIGPEYPNLKLFDFHYFQPCLRMETFWPLWSYNLTSFNNYGNFVQQLWQFRATYSSILLLNFLSSNFIADIYSDIHHLNCSRSYHKCYWNRHLRTTQRRTM